MTAHETMTAYLEAWKAQDWKALLDLTQQSWKATFPRDIHTLINRNRPATPTNMRVIRKVSAEWALQMALGKPVDQRLTAATIIEERDCPNLVPNMARDIEFQATFEVDGTTVDGRVTARLIRETACRPDPAGIWGVNPVSLSRFRREAP